MVDSLFTIGLKGIHTGLANAARDAERITKAFQPESNDDAVDAIIHLKNDIRLVQASGVVIRTGDKLNDSILDILA